MDAYVRWCAGLRSTKPPLNSGGTGGVPANVQTEARPLNEAPAKQRRNPFSKAA